MEKQNMKSIEKKFTYHLNGLKINEYYYINGYLKK